MEDLMGTWSLTDVITRYALDGLPCISRLCGVILMMTVEIE